MTPKSTKVTRNLRIFLWVTRIISNLIVLFIVLFLIGYTVNPQGNPTPNEIILLILFPIWYVRRLFGCMEIAISGRNNQLVV